MTRRNHTKTTRVKRMNLSDQVAAILKDKISNGEWKPDDRIPSEAELADLFEVSRMTVRTALQKLAAVGLVVSRTGDGTFVKDFQIHDVLGDLSAFLCNQRYMEDLNVFRTFFEQDCLTVACERRSQEDIEDIRHIHAQMTEAADRCDIDGFNDADLRLHECIIDMTDNAVFKLLGSIIRELFRAHLEESTGFFIRLQDETTHMSTREALLELCRIHARYITALEERDPSLISDEVGLYMQKYNDIRTTTP